MCIDAPHMAQRYNFLLMERCHLDHLGFLFAFDKTGTISGEHTNWVRELIKEINPTIPDRFIFLDISPRKPTNACVYETKTVTAILV